MSSNIEFMEIPAPDEGVQPGIPSLVKVEAVLSQWESAGVSYCHWKSNFSVANALTGREDLDLLVAASDFPLFVKVLLDNGFKQADSVTSRQQPGVFHFLGNDEVTGSLINVHACTRILTGDHLLKSYALRMEQLLLEDTRTVNPLRLASKASELIAFIFRNMLKHTTVLDLFLRGRSVHSIQKEWAWLQPETAVDEALAKLARYYPEVKPEDFCRALTLVHREGALIGRLRLAFRFNRALRKYRRYGAARQMLGTWWAILRMAYNRLVRKQKHMTLQTGGAIVAFVAPPATGKTTLVKGVQEWLGRELAVRCIHAGKPPSTLFTWLPNNLIPLARVFFPGRKTETVESEADQCEDGNFKYSYLFLVRKVMLAYDRRALLRKAYRWSRNGMIVLSDRYPSDNPGAIDGVSVPDEAYQREKSRLKRFLMRLERRIYQGICPPELVLQLTVSPKIAAIRNRARQKKDAGDEDYVRRRHSMRRIPFFRCCPVVHVSTDQNMGETLLQIKKHIWNHL